MRLKIGILILILHGVYHLNAQETKQSYLDSVLLNDNFKEFIIENGIENVVDKLCDYYLASKPSNIWYSENLLDTNFATWSFVPAKMYVTTLRLKSLFWLYLVFSNTKNSPKRAGVLVYGKDTLNMIFDGVISGDKFFSNNSRVLRYISNSLIAWRKVVKKKGIKYVIMRGYSPINIKYRFIFFDLRH